MFEPHPYPYVPAKSSPLREDCLKRENATPILARRGPRLLAASALSRPRFEGFQLIERFFELHLGLVHVRRHFVDVSVG